MKVDVKNTIWESVTIPDAFMSPFLEWLKQQNKSTLEPSHIHEWLEEKAGIEVEWETLHETSDYMTPRLNDGFSTIEVVEIKRYTGELNGYHSITTWDNADEDKTETQGSVHEEQTTQKEEQDSSKA
jgi:hypothetical protein